MRQPTAQDLQDLLADHQTPCISLYQQTHRTYPGTLEDQIRFKNLLTEAEEKLAGALKKREYTPFLTQIASVAREGREFWNSNLDGMAIFCSSDFFLPLSTQMAIEDSVTVNSTFRTKPLVRILQTTGRYQVLCFEANNIRLFEGNQFALDVVDLRNVPESILQFRTDPRWSRQYLAGPGNREQPVAREPNQRHPDLDHQHSADLIHFMRVVDRAVWENYSRPSNLPMIFCATEENHPLFRQITTNLNLLPDAIKVDPHCLTPVRIREESWKIVGPYFQQTIDQIVDAYRTALAQNKASDALETLTEAATMGRIATLLVDSTKHVPGYLDPATGQMQWGSPDEEARMDDVLDETAERVLRTGGKVFVIPHETMPSETGLAAIYRY